MVWANKNLAWSLGSEESYGSTEAAHEAMRQRTMNFLWERERIVADHEVNWVIESE